MNLQGIWIIRQQKVFLNLSKNLIRNKIAFLLVTHDLQLAEKLGPFSDARRYLEGK